MILNYRQKICIAEELGMFEDVKFTKLFHMLYGKWVVKKSKSGGFSLFVDGEEYLKKTTFRIFKKFKELTSFPEVLPKGDK